jgi:hypothetical protein
MHAKSAQDIVGLEYDWLGTDADGHIALFSTAGGGYAPDAFLINTDAHDAAIEAILAEPATTIARVAPNYPENTWRLVAERGVFAFDADPLGGPYKLVAAPGVGVVVDELPKVAADVVRRLVFPHLKFTQLREIPNELLKQGTEAEPTPS